MDDAAIRGDNNHGEEKWIKHYSNRQKILLVGEEDFSFSVCLAKTFGSATNMVATSLDSKGSVVKRIGLDVESFTLTFSSNVYANYMQCPLLHEFMGWNTIGFLLMNYSKAGQNLEELERRGCTVIHGVDAHTMSHHPLLRFRRFDRIVFNFPHAGFQYKEHKKEQIELHQNLLKGFFRSARALLSEDFGEVHVTHKIAYPFSAWRVKDLAGQVGHGLVEEAVFTECDYMHHGYVNKRGSGVDCDATFPVGACTTFRFCIDDDVLVISFI